MSNRGHNENAMRLGMLADDAQRALERVAQGETDAIEGWLAYGAALNEGRALFPSDKEFGQWKHVFLLSQVGSVAPKADEEIAAMWAAANADQFAEARAAGKARTVRGIHDKWKQIEAERDKEAKRQADEADRAEAKARADAARREADARTKAEAEARKDAEEAATADLRKEAEARADKEAAAKVVAVQEAEAAEKAVAAEPDESPEAAKIRRELNGLTREALVDDLIAAKLARMEDRAKIRAAKAENEELKSKLSEATSGDLGAAVGRLQRRLDQANFARDEAMKTAKREEYKRKQAEKRVAELENLGIALN